MVKVAIIGAGSRGLRSYGKWIADNSELAVVVAVADPIEDRCQQAQKMFNIDSRNVFSDWRDMLKMPKIADAVIIATGDSEHADPAVAAAEKGYHILLEKPMAPTLSDCLRIAKAVKKHNNIFALCHVLRYAPFYQQLKKMVDDGEIGQLMSIQHLEGVAWWHFAHSYVRGNWRNEALSSNILLAKCCHDLDLINWLIGSSCQEIQSFGKLNFFHSENAPSGAADRCVECKYADDQCPYSAKKFYFNLLENDQNGWPLDVLIDEMSSLALESALRNGPYGRCVFKCDNDVVDSQTVSMKFENGVTASMALSAFTPHGRRIRVMGSHGYIEGDGKVLRHLDFTEDKWIEIDINKLCDDVAGGHGGGDAGIMKSFIDAVNREDASGLSAGLLRTVESHLLVFAAEESRKNHKVVDFTEYRRDRASETDLIDTRVCFDMCKAASIY